MKRYLILLAFFCCNSLSFAQNAFNWTDTTFTIGSIRLIEMRWDLDAAALTKENKLVLDTVIRFMKRNTDLMISIDMHTDQQGSPVHNMKLSQARAQSCVNYLISQGGDSSRLIPRGFGATWPIIPLEEIMAIKNKDLRAQRHKRDSLYQMNRRTEVVIERIAGSTIFNWNDKKFVIGAKRKINVLYDLDKTGLIPSSKIILDTVVNFMKKNPNLVVGIYNHTDQQGSPLHDMKLSQARAHCCANYCIYAGGIDTSRIISKGFGLTRPIIPIEQIMAIKYKDPRIQKHKRDSLYQINRRTEVVILKTDYKGK